VSKRGTTAVLTFEIHVDVGVPVVVSVSSENENPEGKPDILRSNWNACKLETEFVLSTFTSNCSDFA
jgi:hypothetical protein